ESLLAEWVRKGIKSVAIPIPGTNGKRITCVVSLLQLGGGCGISDPNLNEQAAEARPPPDVPFKPQLQQDNGSVRPSAACRAAPGILLESATAFHLPVAAMIELNPVRQRIADLTGRVVSLRGYL